eukprot:TRINITY_DN803_c0_g1_i2.p1 TRINITY_DN803_c0_g1~~TRINITY_DN803_c0_g1_i2.p1  ORF type:complete len:110 (-),score=4.27 TRINITY_DN803_c0_g1_i2:101-430(-)
MENLVVSPTKQFVKDSYRLVKRCTKPDARGKFSISLVSRFFRTPLNIDNRIHQDCNCHRNWICSHGFYWILHQTDTYSNQQHPHLLRFFHGNKLNVQDVFKILPTSKTH